MNRYVAFTVAIFCTGFLDAEEVLSSRPLVISPKRIETKTVLPPKVITEEKPDAQTKVKIKKKKESTVAQGSKTVESFNINMNNVILKITFNPGSIRLSDEAQKSLRSLKLKPGQKIRISGFGEAGRKNAAKTANFRARVVASFLDEALGGISAELQWSANPYSCCSTDGAVIERAD